LAVVSQREKAGIKRYGEKERVDKEGGEVMTILQLGIKIATIKTAGGWGIRPFSRKILFM
jgi:hypothetical protein